MPDDGHADPDDRVRTAGRATRCAGQAGPGRRRSRRRDGGRAAGRRARGRAPCRRARRSPRPASRPRSRGRGRRRPRGLRRTTGDGPAGRPERDARAPRSTRPAATSSPIRPRIALRVSPVRATSSDRDSGPRGVQLADDRAEIGPANGLTALPDRPRGASRGFVFLSVKTFVLRSFTRRAGVSSRRARRAAGSRRRIEAVRSLGPPSDVAALGHPRARPHRARARPRARRRPARRRSSRSRAATPGARAGVRRTPTAIADAPIGSYDALLADPRRRRRLHRPAQPPPRARGRSARSRRASTSCARSRCALTVAEVDAIAPRRARTRPDRGRGVHVPPPPADPARARARARRRPRRRSRWSTARSRSSSTVPGRPAGRSGRSAAARSGTSAAIRSASRAGWPARSRTRPCAGFARFDERGVDRTFVGQLRSRAACSRSSTAGSRRPTASGSRSSAPTRRWSSSAVPAGAGRAAAGADDPRATASPEPIEVPRSTSTRRGRGSPAAILDGTAPRVDARLQPWQHRHARGAGCARARRATASRRRLGDRADAL